MKLYTKTGDKGQTSLIGGRVHKDHIRVEAYGTIDELNSFIGAAIVELHDNHVEDIREDLERIQHELFDLGADLSNVSKNLTEKLSEENIKELESKIDQYTDECPPLERFILPGGTRGAALLHIARTITRRAERLIVSLVAEHEMVPKHSLAYINRLSDYLFAAARAVNHRSGVKDIEYNRGRKVFTTAKVKKDENK
ncbi:ATP:cob(I)alamin adenosyltransferase [Bacillus coahuilensis m2-6]|uniref:cob(I)yrinic acid a,c-diamide adenosyltransferase n=1 Tax=Bacillus coahuilensis TaxID=408580 RepID=UPI0001850D5E|nr:cob(I)yrinic acid a,c-diamide adenosyltransferase [Bacillus coahuilensis]KUP08270.1 ATP:cob(I)alamin adenosyltransferase [Bacillus coahuilensis m2-6]